MKTFNFITIFPDLINNFLKYGLINRAIERKIIEINTVNLRDFSDDPNLRIDDKSYGGGPGMVIKYMPVEKAFKSIKKESYNIYLSPQGNRLSQSKISDLTRIDNLTLLCGRYEGYDQRVIDDFVDEQISIGDYVISGGELPALVLIEGITRLLPNVANDMDSIVNDSFTENLLDYPHYTRPESINDKKVPSVLLSGDHQEVSRWRRKQSLGVTWKIRPDLLKNVKLGIEDDKLLKEYIAEIKKNENK